MRPYITTSGRKIPGEHLLPVPSWYYGQSHLLVSSLWFSRLTLRGSRPMFLTCSSCQFQSCHCQLLPWLHQHTCLSTTSLQVILQSDCTSGLPPEQLFMPNTLPQEHLSLSGCPAAHPVVQWFSLGHRTPEWLYLHCLHPGLCLNLFHTLALPPGLPWPCPLVICLWFPS